MSRIFERIIIILILFFVTIHKIFIIEIRQFIIEFIKKRSIYKNSDS